jgi:cytosine/adenosine deaminase-related metal-dependent hydrolase
MSALLLRQVRVVPLDGQAAADPVDVLIEDGLIAELGPAAGPHRVPAVAGEGRWLIPGLWDTHVHLAQWALAGLGFDPLASDPARLRAMRADLTCVAGQVVHSDLSRPGWSR